MVHLLTPKGRRKELERPLPYQAEVWDGYDAKGGQTINKTALTVNIDTERTNTRPGFFALSDDVLTVDSAGTLDIEANVTVGTKSDLSFSGRIYIEVNGVEVTGSQAHVGTERVVATPAATASTLVTVVTKTANYTTLKEDHVILCDATAGAFTVTLHGVAGQAGRLYYIKKIDGSANAITIDGSGSETIDDGLTASLASQYESLTLLSDGTEWHIL